MSPTCQFYPNVGSYRPQGRIFLVSRPLCGYNFGLVSIGAGAQSPGLLTMLWRQQSVQEWLAVFYVSPKEVLVIILITVIIVLVVMARKNIGKRKR